MDEILTKTMNQLKKHAYLGDSLSKKSALIVVDVQNDFCRGGVLGVEESPELIPKLNQGIDKLHKAGVLVVYTQDWHPVNHCSFQENGGTWPAHCVAETRGAELNPDLLIVDNSLTIKKATQVSPDAYSGFSGTTLALELQNRGISNIIVVGIATSFCVKATAIDAAQLGFTTFVMPELCLDVSSFSPEQTRAALEEMEATGVKVSPEDASS